MSDVTQSILYLNDVNVSFDGFKALRSLSLTLEPGEMRAIIGPNGAGKTTMMDVITGKTRPDLGNVLFDLDRYIQDRDLVAADPSLASTRYRDTPFRVAAYGLGVAYADECTIFSVQYTRSVSDAVGSQKLASNTILFRLELKHLGQVNYRVASGAAATPDQIR